MSIRRDDVRLDFVGVEVPDHLRYQPFTVPNPYPNVPPRYLESKPKVAPPPMQFPKEKIPPSTQFQNVVPRYLNERQKPTPVPFCRPREDARLLEEHKTLLAKMGWAGVAPRHLNNIFPDSSAESPRDRVKREKEENRRLLQWRANAIAGVSLTFDEIRQRNKRFFKGAVDHNSSKPKVMKAQSPIAEYIRFGTPVKHEEEGEESHSPRRSHSASGHRGWVPAGGCGGGKWLPRGTSPQRKSVLTADQYVRQWRDRATQKHVRSNSAPRVALLSAANSFMRLHTRESESAPDEAMSDIVVSDVQAASPPVAYLRRSSSRERPSGRQ